MSHAEKSVGWVLAKVILWYQSSAQGCSFSHAIKLGELCWEKGLVHRVDECGFHLLLAVVMHVSF